MPLRIMRVSDMVEITDEVFAVRVEVVEARVRFSEFSEESLPGAPDPELVGVIDRMSCLVAEDHHDLLFRIGDVMAFRDAAKLVIGEVKRDLDRSGPVDAPPRFPPEVEPRIKRDSIGHQLAPEHDQAVAEGVVGTEFELADPGVEQLLK